MFWPCQMANSCVFLHWIHIFIVLTSQIAKFLTFSWLSSELTYLIIKPCQIGANISLFRVFLNELSSFNFMPCQMSRCPHFCFFSRKIQLLNVHTVSDCPYIVFSSNESTNLKFRPQQIVKFQCFLQQYSLFWNLSLAILQNI